MKKGIAWGYIVGAVIGAVVLIVVISIVKPGILKPFSDIMGIGKEAKQAINASKCQTLVFAFSRQCLNKEKCKSETQTFGNKTIIILRSIVPAPSEGWLDCKKDEVCCETEKQT